MVLAAARVAAHGAAIAALTRSAIIRARCHMPAGIHAIAATLTAITRFLSVELSAEAASMRTVRATNNGSTRSYLSRSSVALHSTVNSSYRCIRTLLDV